MSLQAPGLTCASCGGDLYPDPAKRCDDGWHHAYASRGTCLSNRVTRQQAAKKQARLEDVEWMVETGESFSGAAVRLGISNAALERWLRVNGLTHLRRVLLDREPGATSGRSAA